MNESAVDIASLWDFQRPDVSEQRFRSALEAATPDDALILETQIARTYGLRQQFDRARDILGSVEAKLEGASPEALLRYWLELGRTFASAAHSPESQTPEAKARARGAFERAYEIAREAKLDGLAVDCVHMLAFVDPEPADQLRWGMAALAIVESSSQPAAQRWEASIRNNVGYALHRLGRYPEALDQFQRAVALRQRGTNAAETRVAHWMVAWTLRALERFDEALAIQLRLEREGDVAGEPDPYVFEELETLYRQRGDESRADHYAERKQSAQRAAR